MGWHGESSFWREVYARTVAGVATALVVFLLAVASGYVKLHKRGVETVGSLIILFIGAYINNWMLEKGQEAGITFRRRQLRMVPRLLVTFVAMMVFIAAVRAI